MDDLLTIEDVDLNLDYMGTYEAEKVFPDNWSTRDVMQYVQRQRDWFKVVCVALNAFALKCSRRVLGFGMGLN